MPPFVRASNPRCGRMSRSIDTMFAVISCFECQSSVSSHSPNEDWYDRVDQLGKDRSLLTATSRRIQSRSTQKRTATTHQGNGGSMMNVCSLMQSTSRIHLLVDLQEQRGLEDPQFGRRPKVNMTENFPSNVPSKKIGQFSTKLSDTMTMHPVETRSADSHHRHQENVRCVVRRESRPVYYSGSAVRH